MSSRTGDTWIVGDIHGWDDVFAQLLDRLDFDSRIDHLWLTGDLVRRGPDSLAVLRRAKRLAEALGDRFVTVLGNHDLHLLAADLGLRSAGDAQPVLDAPDRRELLDWLRQQPLLHRGGAQADGSVPVLVHAGFWRHWDLADATAAAERIRDAFRDARATRRLLERFAARAKAPQTASADTDSLAQALYGLTMLRALDVAGRAVRYSGPLAELPDGANPWFHGANVLDSKELSPGSPDAPLDLYFGHWAALGFHRHARGRQRSRATCLDSGCAWGGRLTAIRLRDGAVRSVNSPSPAPHAGSP